MLPVPESAGALVAAFALGLFSGAHCIGMCGGIMGALSMALGEQSTPRRLVLMLGYNFGRIGSYTLMGMLFAGLLGSVPHLGPGLRLLAGGLLIAMGLYLAGWWRGLSALERAGHRLWRHLQPLSQRLLPVQYLPQALLLGGLWGWLPCGLVYSALAYATTQGSVLGGGATMLAFGLGTLPAVLASGLAARWLTRLLQKRSLRSALGLAIVLFGVWTLWAALPGSGHGEHDPATEPAHGEHSHG